MAVEVIEVREDAIETWAAVPIRFRVTTRYVVKGVKPDFVLGEEPVDPPYEYDYDLLDPPRRWREWDLQAWGFLAAFDGTTRVGGAAIAFRTPGLDLLEGRDDLASLWDIRVHPDWRSRGVGALLFEAAKAWAKKHGATEMKVETQDINVPACRFYAKQGCRLIAANPGAYEQLPLQVQLLWSTRLA